jgi:hypothetical protein
MLYLSENLYLIQIAVFSSTLPIKSAGEVERAVRPQSEGPAAGYPQPGTDETFSPFRSLHTEFSR